MLQTVKINSVAIQTLITGERVALETTGQVTIRASSQPRGRNWTIGEKRLRNALEIALPRCSCSSFIPMTQLNDISVIVG